MASVGYLLAGGVKRLILQQETKKKVRLIVTFIV